MNPIPQDKIDAIHAAWMNGTPAPFTARTLGIRKDTVLKYQRRFALESPHAVPPCACGRAANHRGQCKARVERRVAQPPTAAPASRHVPPAIPGARLVHGYAGVNS